MTPLEWNDWVIGGKDRLLDQKEVTLDNAVANGLVQGGKKLTRMAKDIEAKRYEIRGQLDDYKKQQAQEKRRKKAIREAQKRGSRKFLENFN